MPRSPRWSGTRIRACGTSCRTRPAPGTRVVENALSRKSLFGLVGGFYQTGQDYPFPLLGIQYFDFDLWKKNKQLSVFFAGALLFANYTDPSLPGLAVRSGRRHFLESPFRSSKSSDRNGEEVRSERIKHLPEYAPRSTSAILWERT